MQVWPPAANTPATMPLVTASRSASSKTTWADLPPSSSVTPARWPIAACATWIPTAVDPVNASLSTPGCAASALPASGVEPVTTLKTPGGSPASSKRRASSSVETGVWSEGFATSVQPAASAGAAFQVSSISGEFHGTIAPTTPTGSWRV